MLHETPSLIGANAVRQQWVPLHRLREKPLLIAWEEPREGVPSSFLLLPRKDHWVAYQNHCPHWSMPLGERVEDLVDDSMGYIFCTSHAAIFRPRDGECVSGPCEGDHLISLEVEEQKEGLWVREVSPFRGQIFAGLAQLEDDAYED